MRRLAVLSFHTSPLAQPGSGDGGGMNVYVRQLAAAMARSGIVVDVYTRATAPEQPAVVAVEPGLRVHHIAAGPIGPVAKDYLPGLVPEFVDGVAARFADHPADAIHANYWLSAVAGHALKHRFDLPLGITFHTLARVKGLDGSDARERESAEASAIGCADVMFASCPDEADELIGLYGADPARVEIVSLGVDHAFFAPGSQAGARRAIGVEPDRQGGRIVLYVGRIQPLKGLDVAVSAFSTLGADASMIVVGGPSGADGRAYLDSIRAISAPFGHRIRWVEPQPHDLLAGYYRAADVVLVPSRSESFGLVALEAAACGVPVVATAVGGLHTLVVDGVTGFLRPRTPQAFASAASAVLADRSLQARLGSAAAVHASAFTWTAAAGRVAGVFSDLTDRVLVACG